MFTSTSRKWIAALVGVLALVLLTGAGIALAAQAHHGPTTSYPAFTQAAHTVNQKGHEQEHVGIVQSIDQAKQTFTLLPASQAKAVTIAYDAHTSIYNDHRTLQLTVGIPIVAHVMSRSDGSLYATKIEPVAAHGNGVPARVNSGSYPAGPYGPYYGRDHHSSGCQHE
jgi:hypothetical protein